VTIVNKVKVKELKILLNLQPENESFREKVCKTGAAGPANYLKSKQ